MDELEAKKAQLTEKLDIKREAAFEKDLILEELASLSTRLHESAAKGAVLMSLYLFISSPCLTASDGLHNHHDHGLHVVTCYMLFMVAEIAKKSPLC